MINIINFKFTAATNKNDITGAEKQNLTKVDKPTQDANTKSAQQPTANTTTAQQQPKENTATAQQQQPAQNLDNSSNNKESKEQNIEEKNDQKEESKEQNEDISSNKKGQYLLSTSLTSICTEGPFETAERLYYFLEEVKNTPNLINSLFFDMQLKESLIPEFNDCFLKFNKYFKETFQGFKIDAKKIEKTQQQKLVQNFFLYGTIMCLKNEQNFIKEIAKPEFKDFKELKMKEGNLDKNGKSLLEIFKTLSEIENDKGASEPLKGLKVALGDKYFQTFCDTFGVTECLRLSGWLYGFRKQSELLGFYGLLLSTRVTQTLMYHFASFLYAVQMSEQSFYILSNPLFIFKDECRLFLTTAIIKFVQSINSEDEDQTLLFSHLIEICNQLPEYDVLLFGDKAINLYALTMDHFLKRNASKSNIKCLTPLQEEMYAPCLLAMSHKKIQKAIESQQENFKKQDIDSFVTTIKNIYNNLVNQKKYAFFSEDFLTYFKDSALFNTLKKEIKISLDEKDEKEDKNLTERSYLAQAIYMGLLAWAKNKIDTFCLSEEFFKWNNAKHLVSNIDIFKKSKSFKELTSIQKIIALTGFFITCPTFECKFEENQNPKQKQQLDEVGKLSYIFRRFQELTVWSIFRHFEKMEELKLLGITNENLSQVITLLILNPLICDSLPDGYKPVSYEIVDSHFIKLSETLEQNKYYGFVFGLKDFKLLIDAKTHFCYEVLQNSIIQKSNIQTAKGKYDKSLFEDYLSTLGPQNMINTGNAFLVSNGGRKKIRFTDISIFNDMDKCMSNVKDIVRLTEKVHDPKADKIDEEQGKRIEAAKKEQESQLTKKSRCDIF